MNEQQHVDDIHYLPSKDLKKNKYYLIITKDNNVIPSGIFWTCWDSVKVHQENRRLISCKKYDTYEEALKEEKEYSKDKNTTEKYINKLYPPSSNYNENSYYSIVTKSPNKIPSGVFWTHWESVRPHQENCQLISCKKFSKEDEAVKYYLGL
jgi:hypothetical protein